MLLHTFRLIHNIWVLYKLFYEELCLSVLQLVAVRAMGPTDLQSFWNVSSNRGFSSAWCSVVDFAHTHTHSYTLTHTLDNILSQKIVQTRV